MNLMRMINMIKIAFTHNINSKRINKTSLNRYDYMKKNNRYK